MAQFKTVGRVSVTDLQLQQVTHSHSRCPKSNAKHSKCNTEEKMANDSQVLKKYGVKLNSKLKESDFEFERFIGRGSFGLVYLVSRKCKSKNNKKQVWAMKILNKRQLLKSSQIKNTRSERCLLETLNHPFLIKMRYAFQNYESLYIVMDYANGGDLFWHIQNDKQFSENRARFYSGEILLAIGYLHTKKILYRDLKPENVLLDKTGHIKLTDFGLSKDMSIHNNNNNTNNNINTNINTKTYTFCGSARKYTSCHCR